MSTLFYPHDTKTVLNETLKTETPGHRHQGVETHTKE